MPNCWMMNLISPTQLEKRWYLLFISNLINLKKDICHLIAGCFFWQHPSVLCRAPLFPLRNFLSSWQHCEATHMVWLIDVQEGGFTIWMLSVTDVILRCFDLWISHQPSSYAGAMYSIVEDFLFDVFTVVKRETFVSKEDWWHVF